MEGLKSGLKSPTVLGVQHVEVKQDYSECRFMNGECILVNIVMVVAILQGLEVRK
jgi:hypothetical protein